MADYVPVLTEDDIERGVLGASDADVRRESRDPRVQLRNSLNISCLADVEPEEVSWLWPGYIPLGKLTVVEGDPGLGKSTLTLAIAAAVSGGAPLPGMGELAEPSDVVLVTYEDGLADTLRPRLDAAGADVTRVHAIQGVDQGEAIERLVQFPIDAPGVFEFVREIGAQLVVIDPLSASLSGETDSYKDQDIRRVLAPMARFAEETGAAVIVVRHLTKSSSGRAIVAGGGSIGIAAAARSVLAVHQDPDAPDDPSARVLAVVKCSLAMRAPSLSFRLTADPRQAVRVAWTGESKHSADGLSALRLEQSEGGSDREIDTWLRSELEGDPVDRKEVFRRASESGFSSRSTERAANRLGVHRSQSGFGKEKRSLWSLRSIPANHANTASPDSPAQTGADSPATTSTLGTIGGNGTHGGNGSEPHQTRIVNGVRQILRPTQHGNRWFDEEVVA
jgi:AAA domain-containing protein